jgi:sugar/nucleoside kinase (ribokinase family)
VVSVVGEDFRNDDLGFLSDTGVDIAGISRVKGKTFRWSGVYLDNFSRRETKFTEVNVFSDFNPVIPEQYRDAEVVFLGNIDPELQKNVLDQMNSPVITAIDTMNFWISLKRPELMEVLKLCRILFVNDEEAVHLSGEKNIIRAARSILKMGPEIVIVKKGEHGAVLFLGSEVLFAPPFPVADVADPTGAGDSFAGGFMGYIAGLSEPELNRKNLRNALTMGSIVASFCVEGFSPRYLASKTRENIEERFGYYKKMCEF